MKYDDIMSGIIKQSHFKCTAENVILHINTYPNEIH